MWWIIIAICAVVGLFFFLRWQKQRTKPDRTLQLFRKARQVGTTPKGAAIYGLSLSADEKIAYDQGISQAIEIARDCKNYGAYMRHSDWRIFVVPSNLSPEQQVPSYCYPYPTDCKRSNNFLIAGEYLLSPEVSEQNVLALAHPKGQISYAVNQAYNELEHGLEFHNDPITFAAHAQAGHLHPLWTDCREASIDRRSGLKCGVRGV